MTPSYLPGEPNASSESVSMETWNGTRILAYCSGNNLVIMEDGKSLLQTEYLLDDGSAVAIDPCSGKIAVGSRNLVAIFKPVVFYNKPLHWTKITELYLDSKDGNVNSIGWSSAKEFVTGSQSLALWSLEDIENDVEGKLLWRKKLANPVSMLRVSPDSYLIATTSLNDKLIKVWKRLSFDPANVDWDFEYLPHPQTIKMMRWRRPYALESSTANVLYSLSEENIMRVWSCYDCYDRGNLQLWAVISPDNPLIGLDSEPNMYNDKKRICSLIIDNGELSRAIEHMVCETSPDELDQTHVDNVIGIGQLCPEIALFIDCVEKKLTAYLIENVESIGQRPPSSLVRVSKLVANSPIEVSTKQKSPLMWPQDTTEKFILRAWCYTSGQPSKEGRTEGQLNLMIHDFRGSLYQYNVDIANLLGRRREEKRVFRSIAYLTGHEKSIQTIARSPKGKNIFTQSRFYENYIWKPVNLPEQRKTLYRASYVDVGKTRVVKVVLSSYSDDIFVTLLETGEIVLWNGAKPDAEKLAVEKLPDVAGPPLAMLELPEGRDDGGFYLVVLYNCDQVYSWNVTFDLSKNVGSIIYAGNHPLPVKFDIDIANNVDPVGWTATISRNSVSPRRNVLTTVTQDEGILRSWTATVTAGRIEWSKTAQINTEDRDITKVQTSSTRRTVVASNGGKALSIYYNSTGLLEFKEEFKENEIRDLDWTDTPQKQSVLGVGFSHEVVLYCQLRFDYTNNTPSWAPFRRVDISHITSHIIGDSIWLKDGSFVVGAGNQMCLYDNKVDINDERTSLLIGSRNSAILSQSSLNIFDVCSIVNGPLPLYHPQLVIQLIFAGMAPKVSEILSLLLKRVRYAEILEPFSVADIRSDLGVGLSEILSGVSSNADSQYRLSTSQTCQELLEWLQKVSLPYLSQHQQITLASVVEAVGDLEQLSRSVDEYGFKALLGYRLFKIHKGSQKSMSMRDFVWAYHSESKSVLLDEILRQHASSGKKLLWPQLREVGIAYWATFEDLKTQFEAVARNYFILDGKRDPVRCTLYFLALKKKDILIGLWRTAHGHPEQSKTIRLLLNDFTEPRWKSAAMKNAYALLGKHRYEYAAAFFLLADSPRDCVDIIVRNMGDTSLAIAVARVYEGNSTVLNHLLGSYTIPKAVDTSDKWLLSWALWISGHTDAGMKALVWEFPGKSFLIDDPVLVLLYRQLKDRKKLVKQETQCSFSSIDLIRAIEDSTVNEYQLVLKTSGIYCRMGCDVLGLDLARNWDFKREWSSEKSSNIKSSSDSEISQAKHEPPQQKEAPKAAFEEPDMSSFAFGF